MQTVAQLRRSLGLAAPRNPDSLYKAVARGPRKFHALKIPRKLQVCPGCYWLAAGVAQLGPAWLGLAWLGLLGMLFHLSLSSTTGFKAGNNRMPDQAIQQSACRWSVLLVLSNLPTSPAGTAAPPPCYCHAESGTGALSSARCPRVNVRYQNMRFQ